MNNSPTELGKTGLSASRITVIYLLVGIFWIVLTTFFVSGGGHDLHEVFRYELIKGLLYVCVTGILLWFLCSLWARQFARAAAEKAETLKQLEAACLEAERANRTKDDFLAVMSHELRTPLNPIMGHTSLLFEEVTNPEHRDSLREILSSAEHMLHLVDDLLFFSYFDQNKTIGAVETFALLPLIERTVAETIETYPGTSVKTENGFGSFLAIAPDESFAGYPDLVIRVVHELLSNAAKFGGAEPILLRLGVKAKNSREKTIRFEIKDTGIGISEALMEKIFTPFAQVDGSRTRRYEGIGLGLAICRKIADFLEADLGGRSSSGEGSCFTFECVLSGVDATLSTSSPTAASPALSAPPKPAGVILVVEDDAANLQITKRILERWNLQVDTAMNGAEALEKCRDRTYDLIFMDLCMPVLNGFEASRQLLIPGSINIETPVVALTAHVGGDVRQRCILLGMKDFMVKPIRVDALHSILVAQGLLS